MTELSFQNLGTGKRVVFITVKNRDYIRVSQIERLLGKRASYYEIYASEKGNPLTRALDLRKRVSGIDFGAFDVVIVGFLPQLVWKAVMKTVKKSGKKRNVTIVADFFLSLYDTVVLDRKLIAPSNPMSGVLRKMDKRALDGADHVLTDTGADADFFAGEYGIDRSKFEVLYLEADAEILKSADSGEVIPKTVLYFGTGLPLQGTDIVIEALRTLSREHGYNCTYIGGLKGLERDNKKHLEKNADMSRELINDIEQLLQNVPQQGILKHYKWVPQKDLYSMISKSSVCLAGHFNPEIDKANRTIPGKAFIYEALGKPMVLGDTVANHEVFKEDSRHRFVPRGDAESIVRAVIELEKGLGDSSNL